MLSATVVSGKAERELVGMCENFLLTTDGTQIERPVENWHLAMQHGKHQVTKAPSQPCKPPNPKSQATMSKPNPKLLTSVPLTLH